MERKAVVLRLLRADAKSWWYFSTLRKQGQVEKAAKLERESIRSKIKEMRFVTVNEIDFNHSYISFKKPSGNVTSWTTSISNVHPGELAAWIYLYAKGLV